MPQPDSQVVGPGPRERTVVSACGRVMAVPAEWEWLPAGDATLTRRVKAGGPAWTVQVKRGRRVTSRGVWASAARIAAIRAELAATRQTEGYAKRRAADAARRERKQAEYVEDFRGAVEEFLGFAPRYSVLARQLAAAIASHAAPIGSGTVARTERLPIERRAEAAVIAWLRHQTTAYDEMKIARVKGRRREVRRRLAEQSRQLLTIYRQGGPVAPTDCPLRRALSQSTRGRIRP